MNVLPGIESCRLLGWHLNVNLVSGHQLHHGAARSLVQEALLVLVVGVHERLVVLVERHPHVGAFAVDVVGEVVDAGDLAGEDARLRVVVLPPVVQELVELHGHPDAGEGREELGRERGHLVDNAASLAFLALVAVGGLQALYPWPHLRQVLSHGGWSGRDDDRGARWPGGTRWPLKPRLARRAERPRLSRGSLQPSSTGFAHPREAGGAGHAWLALRPRQPGGADGTAGPRDARDARGALKPLGAGEPGLTLWPHEPRHTRQPRQALVPGFPLGSCGARQPPQPGAAHFPGKAWLSWETLQAGFSLGADRSWWSYGTALPFRSWETGGPRGAHDARQSWLAGLPWWPSHARRPRVPLFPLRPHGARQTAHTSLPFGPGEARLPNAGEAGGPRQAWQSLLPFAAREAGLAGNAVLPWFANARRAGRALDPGGPWRPLQP